MEKYENLLSQKDQYERNEDKHDVYVCQEVNCTHDLSIAAFIVFFDISVLN